MTDYTTDATTITVTDNSRIAPSATIGSYTGSANAAVIVANGQTLEVDGNIYTGGTASAGIEVLASNAYTVTVTPTGGLTSATTGIFLPNTGTVDNYGGIFANGIALHADGSLTLANYGLLTSTGGSAVWLQSINTTAGSANIYNAGTISGSTTFLFSPPFLPQGVFDTATIVNDGTIVGTSAAISGGVQITLTNHGTITGGINVGNVGGANSITNDGLIVGNISLGGGQDVYDGSVGHIRGTIDMGFGNDTATGGAFAETINGGDGNDTLNGGGGNDTLNGGNNNDILNGGTGIDAMSGGTGFDTFYVDNARDTTIEATNGGNDTVYAAVTYALGAGQEIEHLIADPSIGDAAINLTGNELVNEIIGNDGSNKLDGRGGADTMIGHGGDDVYIVDNGSDVVIEAAGGGNDTVLTSVDYTLATGQEIEGLRASSATATTPLHLTGNEFANLIIGNAGDNVIDGGIGADNMRGGIGNDTYIVDNVNDLVVESVGQGTDTVQASVSYTLRPSVENLTLTGSDAINGTGNAADNVIVGNSNNNTLAGMAGDDTLTGNGGDNTFVFNTALNAATNVDTITDFVHGTDHIALDARYFRGITDAGGTMSAADFTTGAPATKDQHIVYDQASGTLSYDKDGSGAAAAVVFAHVTAGMTLDHNDFTVIA